MTIRTEQSEQEAKFYERVPKSFTYLDMERRKSSAKPTINIQKIGSTPKPIINPKMSNI